eukprot:CAMPEP_0172302940 /NCGR_PEP_ID=MMETSP1058-20130122/4579_1 /TAXON_ID=83371 /ORGANISM="Detonula confervacea, Strain CCMP 353" /LENGTH=520 /DNA_ID=CAMNT_0013013609 /DNA_START=97 /DNA_END=1659 /DNA_ORIENTATION=-
MMRRRSPLKTKSPTLQKLSNATTALASAAANRTCQLIDSASSAVQNGTRLSNAVVHKAEETVLAAERIHHKTPEKKTFGIRDRIHLFDSASRSNVDDQHQRYQQSPYAATSRNKANRYRGGQASPGMAACQEERQRQRGGNDVPPSCNSGYCEKENELNKTQTSTSSKDDVKKPSSTVRQKKKNMQRERMKESSRDGVPSHSPTTPVDTNNYWQDEKEPKTMMAPSKEEGKREEIANNHLEERSNSRHCNFYNETETNHPPANNASRNGNNEQRREKKSRHTIMENNREVADIAELNRAAVVRNSKEGVTTNPSPCTSAGKQKHRSSTNTTTYGTINNNNNHQQQQQHFKKRNPNEHHLLQSPLRKHIKSVHDSASSNATCTMLKNPFPLLLAPSLEGRSAFGAVANWKNDHGASGSGGGGLGSHLDTLGSIMTGNSAPLLNGGNSMGMGSGTRRVNSNGRTERGGGEYCADNNKNTSPSSGNHHHHHEDRANTDGGNEEALDLLTSANFLFKHSRRNLG